MGHPYEMGSPRDCDDCLDRPVMRCGRCTVGHCARHALAPGKRCDACESDYADELTTRRAAKALVAPPIAVLAGGLLLGALIPIALGGAFGGLVLAAVTCSTAVGAGAGACRIVENNARAMFMRERAGRLPAARLLPQRTR